MEYKRVYTITSRIKQLKMNYNFFFAEIELLQVTIVCCVSAPSYKHIRANIKKKVAI